jgi:DNA-binding LacI/PurR family transcriptional regulator
VKSKSKAAIRFWTAAAVRVRSVQKYESPPYGISNINFHIDEERIWRAFAADKRRRLAVITNQPQAERWREYLPTLSRLGIATCQEWWIHLPTDPTVALSARRIAQLLCSVRASERPDALLLGDDNFVPSATAGVADAGLHPPVDISVIAHANFPAPTPSMVQCRRYGLDIPKLLAAAFAEVDRRRQPNVPPSRLQVDMDMYDMQASSGG